MSAYTELQLLKAEEMVLVKITSKFSDQLNRLKVEELALLSEIRESETRAESSVETRNINIIKRERIEGAQEESSNLNQQPLLNLCVNPTQANQEEEEEEEETTQDELTAFMTLQQKQT